MLVDLLDRVKSYGLVIEPFGGDSIVVREIPGILSGCDVKILTLDIINELIENNDSKSVEEQINKVCSKMEGLNIAKGCFAKCSFSYNTIQISFFYYIK